MASTLIMEYISDANKYYDASEPWVKVKEDINAFNDVTYTCLYIIANIANLIYPIMPNGSKKIKNMLSLQDAKWEEELISGNYKINNLEVLYNRLDEKVE